MDLDRFWNPLCYIDNILSETKEVQWLSTTVGPIGEVYIVDRRRIKGIFLETLELNDFPLDVQACLQFILDHQSTKTFVYDWMHLSLILSKSHFNKQFLQRKDAVSQKTRHINDLNRQIPLFSVVLGIFAFSRL